VIFNIIVYDTALAAARSRGPIRCELGYDGGDLPSATSPVVKLAVIAPYNTFVPGLLQCVLATLRVTLWHPGVAATRFIWACARFGARSLRDLVTWQILRYNVRVPSSDSFLAWRTRGPGLSSEVYYRVGESSCRYSCDPSNFATTDVTQPRRTKSTNKLPISLASIPSAHTISSRVQESVVAGIPSVDAIADSCPSSDGPPKSRPGRRDSGARRRRRPPPRPELPRPPS
jgi:hypothetical protein